MEKNYNENFKTPKPIEEMLIDIEKTEKREKIISIIFKVLVYVFLSVFALIIVFPFYWMIITALKSTEEVNLMTPTLYPNVVHLENFAIAMTKADFGRYFLNTLIVGISTTVLGLVVTILAAFAFARLEFKGRDLLFTLLLATMMIPGEMFVISNYQTVYKWGWINSYAALIIPFLVSVFYIYLLRQNFKQVPNELYLAAKVDGTSDFKYLIKVMIPLAMPTIITILILKMMGAWNSYIWPEMVTESTSSSYDGRSDFLLISNALRTVFTDAVNSQTEYNYQMAAVTVVSIPLLIVFVIFRKYIMRGVSRSGIKG